MRSGTWRFPLKFMRFYVSNRTWRQLNDAGALIAFGGDATKRKCRKELWVRVTWSCFGVQRLWPATQVALKN